MCLRALSFRHPMFAWKPVLALATQYQKPSTHALEVLLKNLDEGHVADPDALIRTCFLLHAKRDASTGESTSSQSQRDVCPAPRGLLFFLRRSATAQSRPWDVAATEEAWRSAGRDIAEGAEQALFAEAVQTHVFQHLFAYKAVKTQFEEHTFKVLDVGGFVHVQSSGGLEQRNKSEITTMFENMWYWQDEGGGDAEGAGGAGGGCESDMEGEEDEPPQVVYKTKQFIPRWFKDNNLLTYNVVDCIPPSVSGEEVPNKVYNSWRGFIAETLPEVPASEVEALVEPILEHFRSVICDTPEEVAFHLAFFGQMVQYPGTPTQVGILYCGAQGVGKDIVTVFVADHVLGGNAALRSGNAGHVLGEHSVALVNKVFCVLDEADSATMKAHACLMKDMVTGPTLSVNPKHKTAIIKRNLCNFLVTSNDRCPLQLEIGDRRYVAFACNDSQARNTAYFDGLAAHLKKPRVARAFFQYLQKIDLSGYKNFQAVRPKTALYEQLIQRNNSLFNQFLTSKCLAHPGPDAQTSSTPTEILLEMKAWAEKVGFTTECRRYNTKVLGEDFGAMLLSAQSQAVDSVGRSANGIRKYKRSGGQLAYEITWRRLESSLRANSTFDIHAEPTEPVHFAPPRA